MLCSVPAEDSESGSEEEDDDDQLIEGTSSYNIDDDDNHRFDWEPEADPFFDHLEPTFETISASDRSGIDLVSPEDTNNKLSSSHDTSEVREHNGSEEDENDEDENTLVKKPAVPSKSLQIKKKRNSRSGEADREKKERPKRGRKEWKKMLFFSKFNAFPIIIFQIYSI